MQLRFIGTGAAVNPASGNTGAFFSRGENLFLIDCGEQTFARIMKARLLDAYAGDITVLLTHMHADHCGSLGSLCIHATGALGRKVTIVHPNDDVRILLSLMGVAEGCVDVLRTYEGDGIRILPMQARHTDLIPAFSLMLEDEREKVYYSGDTVELPPQVLGGLRERTVARVYQDVSYFGQEPARRQPHLLYSELLALAEPAIRNSITIMHVNVDFREIAERDGFRYAETDPMFLT